MANRQHAAIGIFVHVIAARNRALMTRPQFANGPDTTRPGHAISPTTRLVNLRRINPKEPNPYVAYIQRIAINHTHGTGKPGKYRGAKDGENKHGTNS